MIREGKAARDGSCNCRWPAMDNVLRFAAALPIDGGAAVLGIDGGFTSASC